MKRKIRRMTGLVLAVILCFCMLPTTAFAATEINTSVVATDGLYSLMYDTVITESGVLTISSSTQFIELKTHTLTNYGTISGSEISMRGDSPAKFYNYGVYNGITSFDEGIAVYDLTLSSIALSSGTLSPSFAAGTREYAVTVDNSVTSIDITPTLNTGTGVKSMTVNGTTATSGAASTVNLSVGVNSIPIVITANDGSDTTNTYTLTVTRASAAVYTIKWVDEDGTRLETDTGVSYGTTPSYDGRTPTKAADLHYTYTFAGWTPEVADVTGDVTYTATYSTVHVGDTYDNGFCTLCDNGYEPATLNNGVYEISNAGQLFWFAALVSGDTTQEGITAANTGASAVLTADITIPSGYEWTPIGTKDAPYTGTFDGNGKTISGMSITAASTYMGLLGYVSEGTIKDLTVSGAIDVSGSSLYAGGIVGTVSNGTLSNLTSNVSVTANDGKKGTFGGVAATVENGSTMELCVNNGNVTASGVLDCVGGLVGYMNSATITNCANYGTVDTSGGTAAASSAASAGIYTGGIVSYINHDSANVTNCFNVGTVSGVDSSSIASYTGAIVGRINEHVGTVTNCYYLSSDGSTLAGVGGNGSGVTTYTTAKTAAEFASGEVAWLLQNGQTSQTILVWGQDLTGQTTTTDDDAYPVLNNMDEFTLRVVQLSFYYLVNNSADTQSFAYGYTNYACVLASYPSESNATYAYYVYDGSVYSEIPTAMAFGDDENIYVVATYPVSRTLDSNVTSSNTSTGAARGDSYSTTLTAANGYSIGSVSVSMGGTDITASAYNSSTGAVSISSVTGAVAITVTATANTYTVTWVDEDGSVLETDADVVHGTTPSYDGDTPTKKADEQYTYTFAGWSPTVSDVTGNVTYTATYSSTINTYTVEWADEDGTVLETDTDVAYGTTPSYDGATPTKAADTQYTYTFAGWTPEVSKVTGNMMYTAIYHSYTATVVSPTYTEQGYTVYTCTHCGDSYEADYTAILVLDGTDSGVSTQTTVQALTELPDGLKSLYSGVDALISDLISRVTVDTGYTADNALVYDVLLQYSTDGGITWITATVDNFPTTGITVTIPYPEGTDSSYEFVVEHMFTVTSERLGITAGDTERPTVTKTEDGLVVTLMGLSPVAVSWKAVTTSATETETTDTSASSTISSQTGDNSPVALWIALLSVSGAGVVGAAAYNRKRKYNR